jgi:hypothetical protein
MDGFGRVLAAALLVLQAQAAAQQVVWRKIDAKGKVVIDLSKERDLEGFTERGGFVVLRYRAKKPHTYRLLTPDGKPFPGTYSAVTHGKSSTRVTTATGEIHVYDAQRRDLTAPLYRAGLKVVRMLGDDFAVARSAEGSGIYALDGKRVLELGPAGADDVAAFERKQGWAIITHGKRHAKEYSLVAPNGKPVEGRFHGYKFDGALVVATRPNDLFCFDAEGRSVLGLYRREHDITADYLGAGLVYSFKHKGVYDLLTRKRVAALDRFCVDGKPRLTGDPWVLKDPRTGRWGALDKTGRTVVPFVYDALESFSKPYARARLKGETFYINARNEKIDAPDGKRPAPLHTKIVRRYKSPGIRLIEVTRWDPPITAGLPYTVHAGRRMIGSYSRVRVKPGVPLLAVQAGDHAGIIGVAGHPWVDPRKPGWTDAWIDEDGTALVSDGAGKLHAQGGGRSFFQRALYKAHPGLKIRRYLGGGHVLASLGEQDLILSQDAKQRIDLAKDAEVGRYGRDGLCPVRSQGRWGAIDRAGKVVIPHAYDTLMTTRDGALLATRDGQAFLVDRINTRGARPPAGPGEPLLLNEYAHPADQRFALARDGKPTTREYSAMASARGLALHYVEVCGAAGLIDGAGREIVPPTYANTSGGVDRDGHAFLVGDGRMLLLDKDGKRVPVAAKNTRAYLGQGLVHAWSDGKHVVARLDGGVVFTLAGHPEHATGFVGTFVDGRCRVRDTKGRWGAIDTSGRLVVPYPKGELVDVVRVKGSDQLQVYTGGHRLLAPGGGSRATTFDDVRVKDGVDFAAVRLERKAGLLGFGRGWWVDLDAAKMKDAWIDQEGLGVLTDRSGRMLFRDKDRKDFTRALHKRFPGLRIHRYLGRGYVHASLAKDKGKQHFVLPPDGSFRINVQMTFPLGKNGLGRFSKEGLCPIWAEREKRWGAIDLKGGLPIKFQYDTLLTTLDGRLLATLDGESFFVDAKNKRVGAPPAPGKASGAVEAACLNPYSGPDRRWVLRLDGEPITREYESIFSREGSPYHKVTVCGAVGVIDRGGREIIPVRRDYRTCSVHEDGNAYAIDQSGRLQVFDASGKNLAAKLGQPVVKYLGHGLAHAQRGNDHFIIALDGRTVFRVGRHKKNAYPVGGRFGDGLCAVRSPTGKWGAIDTRGKLVIPHRYDSYFYFQDGKAVVKQNRRKDVLFAKDYVKKSAPPKTQPTAPAKKDPPAAPAKQDPPAAPRNKAGTVTASIRSRSGLIEVVHVSTTANGSKRYELRRDGKRVAGPADFVLIKEGVEWAAIRLGSRKVGLLDFSGRWVADPRETRAMTASIAPDGTSVVRSANAIYCYRTERRNLAEPLAKVKDLKPLRYVGEGFVYATGKARRPGLFALDGQTTIWLDKYFSARRAGIDRFGNERLCPIRSARLRRWGAIDRTGKLVIPFEYDSLMTTHDGRLLAVLGDDTFYVNGKRERTGKPPAPIARADGVTVLCLNEHAHWDDRRRVLRRDGKTISREYGGLDTTGNPHLFRARAGRSATIVDSGGRALVPLFEYEQCFVHEDGRAYFARQPGQLHVIDENLNDHTAPVRKAHPGVRIWRYLGEARVYAAWKGGYGVLGLDGRVVFRMGSTPKGSPSSNIRSYSEGLCAVRAETGERKWGAIDARGKLVVPYRYDASFRFKGGKATVRENRERKTIRRPDPAERTATPGPGPKPARKPVPEAAPKPTVVCVNPKAKSWERIYVLQIGDKRTRGYDKITLYEDHGLAVVRGGKAHGLIDLTGKEILAPTTRFSSLVVGDPWITAGMDAETVCHVPRTTYGYIDRQGNTKVDFGHDKAGTFRDGGAWVMKLARNPDLAVFRHPEEWFTENRTVFRQGNGKGSSILSEKTNGKYARILSGQFKDGKLHGLAGEINDPRYGRVIANFENGKMTTLLRYWDMKGRRFQGTLNAQWKLNGYGVSWRTNGTLDFVGQWRNGREWTGTGYLKDDPKHRVDWKDGVKRGLRKAGYAYKPPPKPKPKPKPGERTMTCNACNGTREIYQQGTHVWVPRTSLILAGHRLYGSRWTHFESPNKGHWETKSPSGYFACYRCRGAGYIRY